MMYILIGVRANVSPLAIMCLVTSSKEAMLSVITHCILYPIQRRECDRMNYRLEDDTHMPYMNYLLNPNITYYMCASLSQE